MSAGCVGASVSCNVFAETLILELIEMVLIKKIVSSLLVIILFHSCNPMEDDDLSIPNDGSISIQVSDNYYLGTEFDFLTGTLDTTQSSGAVYITNRSRGVVVLEEELLGGEIIDSPNSLSEDSIYDCTFLRIDEEGPITSFRYYTFLDVGNLDIDLNNNFFGTPPSDTAILRINHNGLFLTRINASKLFRFNTGQNTSTLFIGLNEEQEDVYIVFEDMNGIERYLSVENVESGFNQEYNYFNLPIFDDCIEINYSDFDFWNVSVSGQMGGSSKIHRIDQGSSASDGESYQHCEPTDLFDSYFSRVYFEKGNYSYNFLDESSILVLEPEIPNIDINVSSNSINGFNLGIAGEYDYYRVCFNTLDESMLYEVKWIIYGKSPEEIYFEVLDIFNKVREVDASFDISDLTIEFVSVDKVEDLGVFSNYISSELSLKVFYDNYISISRRY